MAITGPPPKPADQRRRRNPPAHGWVDIPARAFPGAPTAQAARRGALARRHRREMEGLGDDAALHALGRLDCSYAVDSLLVAARFFEHESTAAAAELRIREMQMGCCWSGRQSLRLRYVAPVVDSGDEASSVVELSDYRNL